MLHDITPVILTYNEAPNIGRMLAQLDWASDIVVVDSGSTDQTLDIVGRHPMVRIFHRPFDHHREQWVFATENTGITSNWILRLDADYILPPPLIAEIGKLNSAEGVNAYIIGFDYALDGRKLSGSLYPSKPILLRRGAYEVRNAGHTEAWYVYGRTEKLNSKAVHDDRKPLRHWLQSQLVYARREAEYLLSQETDALSRTDRLRRLGWIMPLAVIPYTLFVKCCILDGGPGWHYALQRLFAETAIAIEIVQGRRNGVTLNSHTLSGN